jgi:hypothetical protein
MKIVTDMDEVFRLSDRAYRKALRTLVKEGSVNVGAFGKSIGIIETNFTDMSVEEAQDILGE